jgi:hypothetical protein
MSQGRERRACGTCVRRPKYSARARSDGVGARTKGVSPVKPQGGEPNSSAAPPQDRLTEVEVVDPDTGRTRVEYRREGRAIGASDPEGRGA